VTGPPPLGLKGLSSNKVPEPFKGTKTPINADIRRILSVPGVGPGPAMTLALTFQSGSLVRPALCTGGELLPLVAKLITAESKTKSPWNPT